MVNTCTVSLRRAAHRLKVQTVMVFGHELCGAVMATHLLVDFLMAEMLARLQATLEDEATEAKRQIR